MKKFSMHDERFGDTSIVHEAESYDSLADECANLFRDMAVEEYGSPDGAEREQFIARRASELRAEFIDALVEIPPENPKYGHVVVNGNRYNLTSQAELSGLLVPGGWETVSDGETYTAEWRADGLDDHGNLVVVYWQWAEVRGDELEDASGYDFSDDNIDRVEVL